jgi:hypothetical protein
MQDQGLLDLHNSFVERRPSRTESDIQSAIAAFLLLSPFGLEANEVVKLEDPMKDGTRRRIDISIGKLVIEVKKDLSNRKILNDGLDQLGGYLETRSQQDNFLFAGILTDGQTWLLLGQDPDGSWLTVDQLNCTISNTESHKGLINWLSEILLTGDKQPATQNVIQEKFGSSSAGHLLDISRLRRLYEQVSENPSVMMKRSLWARLLRTALGDSFSDNTDLFLKHSLLVYQAEIVAHLVVGIQIGNLSSSDLVLGKAFKDVQIFNVVEEDFFDWILEAADGPSFLDALARRVSSVDWGSAEHDVLKTLYQSVIDPETRKKLGEYYTPDWLAIKAIDEVVPVIGDLKVMDPSCGSGTFLFHLIRKFLGERESSGQSNSQAIEALQRQIYGLDLHPVSVVLARVTFLLAIGPVRLQNRGPIAVPIYLGDSLQWFRNDRNLGTSSLRVPVDNDELVEIGSGTQMTLFTSGDSLEIPLSTLQSTVQFDTFVDELARLANTVTSMKSPVPSIEPIFRRHGISNESEMSILTKTFSTLCELNALGRNHIWGYFIRNQLRPAWLSLVENRVDVLVGNPPWVAYRHMSPAMQDLFKKASKESGLWSQTKLVTQMDLVALFIVRSSSLYLKPEGRFGFVTPWSVLGGPHYEEFRTGKWGTSVVPNENEEIESVYAEFKPSWDLSEIKGDLFPQTSAVVFGSLSSAPAALPLDTKLFIGSVAEWRMEDSLLPTALTESDPKSHYYNHALQGATIVPRYLFMVERVKSQNPLGAVSGEILVRSKRSADEKAPWKNMGDYEGFVEEEFIYRVLMGSSIAPFRILSSTEAVLPIHEGKLVTQDELNNVSKKMASRWGDLESLWVNNKQPKSPATLIGRLNYQRTLEKQLPVTDWRVVYTTSGTRLCAAIVRDRDELIDAKLYWIPALTESEAHFLSGVLNSRLVQNWVNPRQSKGLFGPRDFHRVPLTLPIPRFDPESSVHLAIALLSSKIEKICSDLEIANPGNFKNSRTLIEDELVRLGLESDLDVAVGALGLISN